MWYSKYIYSFYVLLYRNKDRETVKGQCNKTLALAFFHDTVSPQSLIYFLLCVLKKNLRRYSQLAKIAGVNDTGEVLY